MFWLQLSQPSLLAVVRQAASLEQLNYTWVFPLTKSAPNLRSTGTLSYQRFKSQETCIRSVELAPSMLGAAEFKVVKGEG